MLVPWPIIFFCITNFELIYDYAKWLVHEWIHHVWLSIRLNYLIARHKTNWTKKSGKYRVLKRNKKWVTKLGTHLLGKSKIWYKKKKKFWGKFCWDTIRSMPSRKKHRNLIWLPRQKKQNYFKVLRYSSSINIFHP